MLSIQLERVAFAYTDAVPVLADVTVHLTPGSVGIVGENGAGKTTLVRIIAGELAPTSGRITRGDARVALCEQGVDVLTAAIRAFAVDETAGRWRGQLALDPDQLDRWPTLSPGERRRWQLGAALAGEPDVLILDEPTNHIDGSARRLITQALRRYRGIALIISHDRALLDELTTQTLRVHAGGAQLVPGNYTAAKATWEAHAAHVRDLRASARRVADHAREKLADARRDRHAAEAQKSGKKRKKGIRDHDSTSILATTQVGWAEAGLGRRVEVARKELARAEAAIPDAPPETQLGRSVFVGYAKSPRRWLLGEGARAVAASDRIRVAGPNGAGKTTLLRELLATSTLPAERVLYLPQELSPDEAQALLAQARALPADERGRVLSLVAALGVEPARLLASRSPSPGEARKLALALGLGRHAWLLVLDEPTNHLDLPSIERLEEALRAFPGALVLATHDDAFAAALVTQTWDV